MNILWLTWRDLENPLAGGAEVVNEELAKRLAAKGHTITFLVAGFKDGKQTKKTDGYSIIRTGNRLTVYPNIIFWQYWRHRKGVDIVIDELNTLPFFAGWYAPKKSILFVHQLARKVWFYQLPKALGAIGYILEPVMLRLLSHMQVITVSNSTKQDLMRHGFKQKNISIISEGIQLQPLKDLSASKKFNKPTMLSLGSVRPMKRTLHQIEAFESAKTSIPDLQLVVAGPLVGAYGQTVKDKVEASIHSDDIELLGSVSEKKKRQLLEKSHVFVATGVKEGWCLVVTEANSQGTPSVVYDVDGLRDSVQDNKTGLIAVEKPSDLAKKVVILLGNEKKYQELRQTAWQWSKTITFDTGVQQFEKVLKERQ